MEFAADSDRAGTAHEVVVDRGVVDRDILSDQAVQIGERSAQAPLPRVEDRFPLLGASFRIDIGDAPPALGREHVAGDLDDLHVRQAGDVDGANRSGVDVIRVEGVTRPAVGIFADPAPAQRPAGACLQERAGENVRFRNATW